MNFAKQAEKNFTPIMLEEFGVLAFKVELNTEFVSPGTAPSAGTAYSTWDYKHQPRVADWGTYVFGWVKEEETNLWYYWVPALPTTVVTKKGTDPVFGPIQIHKKIDYLSSSIPDRGTIFDNGDSNLVDILGANVVDINNVQVTHGSGRIVENVSVREFSGEVGGIEIVTVDNSVVVSVDQINDERSGTLLDVTTEDILASTRPNGWAATDLGVFADVKKVRHNHWQRISRKATGFPLGKANAIEEETTGSILWPAVLKDYKFIKVSNDMQSDQDYYLRFGGDDGAEDRIYGFQILFSYSMRDPYAGDVRLVKRKWMQKEKLDAVVEGEMLPSGLDIRGRALTINLPECLHGVIEAKEYNFVTDDMSDRFAMLFHRNMNWSVPATNLTEWPEKIVQPKSELVNGMYFCEEWIYYRPAQFFDYEAQNKYMTLSLSPASYYQWQTGF